MRFNGTILLFELDSFVDHRKKQRKKLMIMISKDEIQIHAHQFYCQLFCCFALDRNIFLFKVPKICSWQH